jgi:thymidylate kinase
MGIDGSGKSTVSEHLAAKLRERGYKVKILWLRFNHVFSKPLLGLCRLLGLTRYETREGIRVGYHDFYRSRVISWLFVLLQYLDAVRVRYFRVLPAILGDRKVLILDRYVYDILIDVMVDTRMADLHRGWVGRAFRNLLPKDTLTLLVDRDLNRVLAVRPEGRVDSNFEARYAFYRALRADDRVSSIANDGRLDDLLRSVEQRTGLET